MNKKKLIVYPYNEHFSSILRHKELLDSYDVVGLISPRGWGLTGKDAGEADGGCHLGMKVSSDFEGSIDLCDAVLFCESRVHLEFETFIMPKVKMAANAGKNIIFTYPLENDMYNMITNECNANQVDFKYYNNSEQEKECIGIDREIEHLYDINTPVIFVLGIGEKTSKFEIQLSLRENIKKMGYQVSQIGSRGYCELLGFHSLPSFMYNNSISETNKIVMFNQYIRNMEKEESPDVIIIGVPGGIMPFNNKLVNRFGILAYEISMAVTPDACVFSTFYEDYKSEYFEKMVQSIQYKLGFKVDCFNMANVMLDWLESNNTSSLAYTSLDSKYIDEKLGNYKELDTPIFNVYNQESGINLTNCLINKLIEYGETECI